MSYIGSTPTSQAFAPGTDTFSGTGSQTAFTLTRNVGTVNDILVVVNNVDQQPSAYSVSGSTLTMSAAPSSGTNNVYVRYLSTNLTAVAPSQGSVAPNSLTTGGPSWDASGNLSVPGNATVGAAVVATGGVSGTTGSFTGNMSFNSGFGSAAVAYGCRAWVNFNGTTNTGGFCTIRASGNVTSVADNGTGDYTINFSSTMPDANYSYVFGGSLNRRLQLQNTGSVATTSSIRVQGQDNTSNAADIETFNVAIFR